MDLLYVLMHFVGGLVLLMYGLNKLGGALQTMLGDGESLRKRFQHPFSAFMGGMMFTALAQSSAATTALAVGFVSANLLALRQALVVILGADIGTALVVQMIAFRLHEFALILVIAGYFLRLMKSQERLFHIGRGIMALGFVFLGIHFLSMTAAELRTFHTVDSILSYADILPVGLIVGAVITALMQSSAAFLGVVISFANGGALGWESVFALILGANIGSCVTAFIVSLDKSRNAKRAALGHLLIKLSGVTIVLSAYLLLTHFATDVVPGGTLYGRQVANMHLLFNLFLALIFFPLLPLVEKILFLLLPRVTAERQLETRYLDEAILSSPSLALVAAGQELHRVGTMLENLLNGATKNTLQGSFVQLRNMGKKEKDIDFLYRKIIEYLGKIGKHNMSAKEAEQMLRLLQTAHAIEQIGDLCGNTFETIGRKRLRREVVANPETVALITKLEERVIQGFHLMLENMQQPSRENLHIIAKHKTQVKRLVTNCVQRQADRLSANEKKRFETFNAEMDVVETWQRIFYYIRRNIKTIKHAD